MTFDLTITKALKVDSSSNASQLEKPRILGASRDPFSGLNGILRSVSFAAYLNRLNSRSAPCSIG